ncbi:MAG: hypothetical protein V1850_05245 [Candidatus Bathyarchaeota archaeon]
MTSIIGMHGGQRGLPSGRSSSDYDVLESMVVIASKHDLETKRLIDAFFDAFENGISHCGSLEISLRKAD